MCLYFSNSVCQAFCDIGGNAPVIGFHSVIDSPDSVRRVTPPKSTCIIIINTPDNSQIPTALLFLFTTFFFSVPKLKQGYANNKKNLLKIWIEIYLSYLSNIKLIEAY